MKFKMKFEKKNTLKLALALPVVLAFLVLFGSPQIHPSLAYRKPYLNSLTDFSLFGYSPLGQRMSALMAWGYWQTILVAVIGRSLALAMSFVGLFVSWMAVIPGLKSPGFLSGFLDGKFAANLKIEKSRRVGFFWTSRFSEAFMTIPSLLLALSLGYLVGEGFFTMIFVIGLSEWAYNQKWLLGRLREYERFTFVEAGEAMGGGRFHIFKEHFLPFIFSDLVFLFFLYLPGSLLTVTSLEFLGLSSGAEIAGLGSIIALNKDLVFLYPHVILPPAILIVITVLISVILKNEIRPQKTG